MCGRFNMSINIWEERIVKDDGCKEPKKAFIYFQEYLNLGVGRKLSKVVEKTGKSDRYIKKLSYTWDWVKRADAYDLACIETMSLENRRRIVHSQTNAAISNILISELNRSISELLRDYLIELIEFEETAESFEELEAYVKRNNAFIKHLKRISSIQEGLFDSNLGLLKLNNKKDDDRGDSTFIEQNSLTFNSMSQGDLVAAVREAFGLNSREQVLKDEERNKKIKEHNDTDFDFDNDFI